MSTIFRSKISKEVVEVNEVRFASRGGGFMRARPASVFFAEYLPYKPCKTPRPSSVFLDGITYPCLLHELRWNGWGVPVFTKEVAEKVAEEINTHYPVSRCRLSFDADQNRFIFTNEDDIEQTEVFPGQVINGVMYYPIGAGSWTWNVEAVDEVDEAQEAMAMLAAFVEAETVKGAADGFAAIKANQLLSLLKDKGTEAFVSFAALDIAFIECLRTEACHE